MLRMGPHGQGTSTTRFCYYQGKTRSCCARQLRRACGAGRGPGGELAGLGVFGLLHDFRLLDQFPRAVLHVNDRL